MWRWVDLEGKGGLPPFLKIFLSPNSFKILNVLRVLVSISQLWAPNPVGLTLLFLFHVLTLLRWLGAFNGGSDPMNLLLLWTTALGLFMPHQMGLICLWYITLNLGLSYFKSGWFKLKNSNWRNGNALVQFLNSPTYEKSAFATQLTQSPVLSKMSSWVVIIFEITFPLSVIHPHLAIAYMTMGVLFHFMNAYFFSLNRFTFAWIAAYPALYYCSSRLTPLF